MFHPGALQCIPLPLTFASLSQGSTFPSPAHHFHFLLNNKPPGMFLPGQRTTCLVATYTQACSYPSHYSTLAASSLIFSRENRSLPQL